MRPLDEEGMRDVRGWKTKALYALAWLAYRIPGWLGLELGWKLERKAMDRHLREHFPKKP